MKTKSVVTLLSAISLAACGGGTEPKVIQFTQAQVEDMMDALATLGTFDTGPGFARASALSNADVLAAFTTTLDETEPCPAGGTQRLQGTVTGDDAGTQITGQITQTFQACRATGSSGKTWTFNGAPSLVANFSMSFNEARAPSR